MNVGVGGLEVSNLESGLTGGHWRMEGEAAEVSTHCNTPTLTMWRLSRNHGTIRARCENLELVQNWIQDSYYCLLTLLSEGLEGQCK